MFSNCNVIKEIDLSSFNTKNVSSMTNMFNRCNLLEKVKIGENFSLTGTGTTNCGLAENLIVR